MTTFNCINVELAFLLSENELQCTKITGDISVIIGYSNQDLLLGAPNFISLFHPDDADIVQSIFSYSEQVKPISLTFRLITLDGRYIIVRACYVKSANAANQQTVIQIEIQHPKGLDIDIVEKSALGNFIAMLENTNDYIYFKDRNHIFTGASQMLVEVTNPTKHWTDLIGKTDYDVLSKDYADIYYTLEKQVFNGEISVARDIQPFLDNDGNEGWVDNRKYPIHDADGNIIGLFGIARDITQLIWAEEELKKEKEYAESIIETAQAIILVLDLRGCIVSFNSFTEFLLGYSLTEIKGKNWIETFVPENDQIQIQKLLDAALYEKNTKGVVSRIIARNGTEYFIEWHDRNTRDNDGNVSRLIAVGMDVTERFIAEAQLRLNASVFTSTHESIIITDGKATIVDVNDAFTVITGYSREEVLGKNARILHSEHSSEFYDDMWQSLLDQGYWSGEICNRHKNGELIIEYKTISAVYDESGATTNYVALATNITEMKEYQQELERITQFDSLTNLPNRSLLFDRLNQAMAQCLRHSSIIAVLFLDLDGFKEVNDKYGHDIGDQLLFKLAERMALVLRDEDTLARLGGDEFVAVLVSLEKVEACEPILERLLHAVSEPTTIDGISLKVSASIGVTIYPEDVVDAEQLMRHADQAMYVAKENGKNQYHVFDTAQQFAIKKQRENLANIRDALEHEQFVLYYQPKVNMKTGDVIGVEALIRWQHPKLGLLAPNEFLPIIENHVLGIELGKWVLNTAMKQLSQWQKSGIAVPVSVSVNIAAMHLQDNDFVAQLKTILAAYPNVEPGYLELEILETSALEDLDNISVIMKSCLALGVKFSIDDFGTGYSSLTYLRRLPANLIKVDQSFVRDMLEDPDDYAIVESVISLAKSFKRDVIAEGVETVEHGTALLQLGCELAQGYGIAKPMPPADIPAWIKEWKLNDVWQN